jgi:hypothetical protein
VCGYVTKPKWNRRPAVGTAAQVRGYIENCSTFLLWVATAVDCCWLCPGPRRIRLSVVWYRAGWCIRPWPESDTARSSHPSSAFELSVLSLLLYTRPRGLYSCWPFSLLYIHLTRHFGGALLLLLDDAVDVNSIVGGWAAYTLPPICAQWHLAMSSACLFLYPLDSTPEKK